LRRPPQARGAGGGRVPEPSRPGRDRCQDGEARREVARQAMNPAALGRPTEAGARPPLKWAGGKRWLVPHLRTLWEPHRHLRLVEPLCGGLAVALSLGPSRALLNDVNPHAINFYRWLQKGLRPRLAARNDRAAFYAGRRRFNELVAGGRGGTREAAELFYYLNRTGYNGLCRFNSKGEFNVPFGSYRTI